MAIGKINGISISASPATTELQALTDPIFNNSSQGESYTDTAGDTYGTTASQTSFTAPAVETSIFRCFSGHVDAGTGSFQVYNSTDATQISVVTTTATSETALSVSSTSDISNANDSIILRLKNSGAGNTTTIDFGGIGSCDRVAGITAINLPVGFSVDTSSSAGAILGTIKIIPLMRKSTATFDFDLGQMFAFSGIATYTQNILASFDETDNGVITTVNSDSAISPTDSILLATTVADTESLAFAMSGQIKYINA